jgi:hypothetical protein
MVKLAMIRLMLHRLAHPNRKRLPALSIVRVFETANWLK